MNANFYTNQPGLIRQIRLAARPRRIYQGIPPAQLAARKERAEIERVERLYEDYLIESGQWKL